MLMLSYWKQDPSKPVRVLSDPEGIRDLYWQLHYNYKCDDGTAITKLEVANLEGVAIDPQVLMVEPHIYDTRLS